MLVIVVSVGGSIQVINVFRDKCDFWEIFRYLLICRDKSIKTEHQIKDE